MDLSTLSAICPQAPSARLQVFVAPLVATLAAFEITTPIRQAAFLAQCAHESGQFLYLRELASGDAYEGRIDLGNTQQGDGRRYKGGGLIEITGRYNFRLGGEAIGVDLEAHPELIELPDNACKVSGWFWATRGLNALADTDAFGTITHRVNGGYNGLDARILFWLRGRRALKVA